MKLDWKRLEQEAKKCIEVGEKILILIEAHNTDRPPRIRLNDRDITKEIIIPTVAQYYGITTAELIGQRRIRYFTDPRHIAIFISSEVTILSQELIGQMFGNRDHGTILNAVRGVRERMIQNKKVAAQVEELRAMVQKKLDEKKIIASNLAEGV